VHIKIGAELFGHAGVACDIELILLMAETLRLAGIRPIHLVLGHVGIFRGLVAAAGLNADAETELFDLVQRKAYAEIDAWLDTHVSDHALRDMLSDLSQLSGGVTVVDQADKLLARAPATVRSALDELRQISDAVCQHVSDVSLGFDLSELRGYQYHTGTVFAAYTPAHGKAVAKGGRYDEIGKVFGRARPASGFDADLKMLAQLSNRDYPSPRVVLAPDQPDATLQSLIARLRNDGDIVIQHLGGDEPDENLLRELQCSARIVADDKLGWRVAEQ